MQISANQAAGITRSGKVFLVALCGNFRSASVRSKIWTLPLRAPFPISPRGERTAGLVSNTLSLGLVAQRRLGIHCMNPVWSPGEYEQLGSNEVQDHELVGLQ